MINPWFKFYGAEYLSDPKIGYLTAQERSCWITLLCLASSSTTGGVIEYLTVEVLLDKSGIRFDPYSPEEWNKCLSVLTKFEKMKMLDKDDSGKITIINWNKRQETSLTNAERQAKYRESRKSNEIVTGDVTKVTLEKNRKEKKREDNTVTSVPPRIIFIQPTVEEVTQYCTERGNEVNPQQFVDHYMSNGWKIGGKSAMKDWKAAIRTWEKNSFSKPLKGNTVDKF